MQLYLSPEEVAQQLKVEMADILGLVECGKIRAMRIGNNIRIPEMELDKLLVTCAAAQTPPDAEVLHDGSRWCRTRTGTRFRVSGSIADGAEIWPGQMRYPIRFAKSVMKDLLAHFNTRGDVAVGGSFDGPSSGSLGEFIQQRLNTKMNPAVYVAALLLEEGLAEPSPRRGHISFVHPAYQKDELPKTLVALP
jgi:excisionase family DNA binding protein